MRMPFPANFRYLHTTNWEGLRWVATSASSPQLARRPVSWLVTNLAGVSGTQETHGISVLANKPVARCINVELQDAGWQEVW